MPIKCPPAPTGSNPGLAVQSSILKAGTVLTRFHSKARAGNVYNPNEGKSIEIEEDGARFNPFPGEPATNVPTLYAADNSSAAALESIFHGVKHIPSPTFPRIGLKESCFSELTVNDDLIVIELMNPQLRQLAVAGRRASLSEAELIHTSSPSIQKHTHLGSLSARQSSHTSSSLLAPKTWRNRARLHAFRGSLRVRSFNTDSRTH